MKSKKGIEVKFLIGLIILLVSFVLILAVYYLLFSNTSQIDKEACHASVITRATISEIPVAGWVNPVSVNCKTEKICITSNTFAKGDCEDELGEDYITLRVSREIEKQPDEINKILAEKNYECWQMMGEGKVNVFAGQSDRNKDAEINSCVICTRIAFDKTAIESGELVKEVKGLHKYQLETKVPNSDLTFHQFLTNSYYVPAYGPEDELNDIFLTTQKSIVFYESNRNAFIDFFHIGVGCVGAGVLGAKAGAVVGSVVPGAGTATGAVSGFVVGCVGGAVGGEYWTEFLASLGKDDITTGYTLRDYTRDSIEEMGCSDFQSLP